MSRPGVRTVFIATLVAFSAIAATAQATPITLEFSGSFTLSGSPNTFNGTLTWDTTTAPFITASTEKLYRPSGGSLVLNGVDVTADLGLPFSFIGVSPNSFGWQFDVFGPPVNGSAAGLTALAGHLIFGSDLFSPTLALPGDLSFVSLGTPASAVVLADSSGVNGTLQVVTPAAVPEPASMLLLGTGLIGLAARRRRNRG